MAVSLTENRTNTATPGWFSNVTGGAGKFCILLAILLAAVALRIYCMNGYWGTDDGEYALLANAMAQGNFADFVRENYFRNFNAPAHLPYRMALIAPLSALFRVFGVSEIALLFYPFSISIFGVILAFLCGRLLFSVNAGLISAALWSVFPVDVDLATFFLPDAIASFYGSAGVLVVLFVVLADIRGTFPRFLGGLIAGLLFGISWLSKESIVYLAPFCLFLLVSGAKRNFKGALPLWIGVAAASGGVLLTEMLVYYAQRGDFLLRMHENERSFEQTRSYLFYEGSRFGWPVGGSHMKALLKRLFLDGPSVIFLNEQSLFLPFFGLIAAAHAFHWRDRSFLIPALWMLTLAFMYNFASCSLSAYTPLVLLDRYLHPIMLPAAVLTGGFIAKLLAAKDETTSQDGSRERFFWGMAIACLVATTSLYFAFRQIRDRSSSWTIYEIRRLSGLVKPTDKVYTDPLSGKALEFFWKYPQETKTIDFEGMRADEIEPNSFVLADKVRVNWLKVNVSMWLTKDYGYREPEFLTRPPESWKRVWQNRHATLYKVE
jgi:4-amino-4-deoxy-L-arabinose transferase-like glycosyltransferase